MEQAIAHGTYLQFAVVYCVVVAGYLLLARRMVICRLVATSSGLEIVNWFVSHAVPWTDVACVMSGDERPKDLPLSAFADDGHVLVKTTEGRFINAEHRTCRAPRQSRRHLTTRPSPSGGGAPATRFAAEADVVSSGWLGELHEGCLCDPWFVEDVVISKGCGVTRRIRQPGSPTSDSLCYGSLEDAREDPDAVVVLSGDYGGTIYLFARVRLVGCDHETLVTLLSDLDAISWMNGDGYWNEVRYEHHQHGDPIVVGDGGGEVAVGDNVWTHPQHIDNEVAQLASMVVRGTRARLPAEVLRDQREARIERRRRSRTSPDNVALRERHGITWDFDVHPPAVPFPER